MELIELRRLNLPQFQSVFVFLFLNYSIPPLTCQILRRTIAVNAFSRPASKGNVSATEVRRPEKTRHLKKLGNHVRVVPIQN
jgi:hypothetical protein